MSIVLPHHPRDSVVRSLPDIREMVQPHKMIPHLGKSDVRSSTGFPEPYTSESYTVQNEYTVESYGQELLNNFECGNDVLGINALCYSPLTAYSQLLENVENFPNHTQNHMSPILDLSFNPEAANPNILPIFYPKQSFARETIISPLSNSCFANAVHTNSATASSPQRLSVLAKDYSTATEDIATVNSADDDAISCHQKKRPKPISVIAHRYHTSEKRSPYAVLIYEALMSVPSHKMVLSEIYDYFRNHFPGFRRSKGRGWMNSIRHNLSMNGVSIPLFCAVAQWHS